MTAMTQRRSPELPDPDVIFNIPDYRGRWVRLTQRTFENHIPIHPDVAQYVEEAKQIIAGPDGASELRNGATFLYRYGLGRGIYARCYLCIVVYYRQMRGSNQGVVATYHFHRKPPNGSVIETRYQWMMGERFAVHGLNAQEEVDGQQHQ